MKNLKYFLILIFITQGMIIAQNETVYEDAEDGSTARWQIYDNNPDGAAINNIFDNDKNSRVIEFVGSQDNNGFVYSDDANNWTYISNTTQFIADWSMKTNEAFRVYFYIKSSDGDYYLVYDSGAEGSNSISGNEIYYGLGETTKDGTWHTFQRNLKNDFETAVEGKTISEVYDILIRCNGRIDDVKLEDDSALPVELTTFTSSIINNKVKLYWETATEVNNYGFEIQRQNQVSSIENQDKSRRWEKISFVDGNGNSNSPKNYEYVDNTVNSGKYLYRLKQIDIDGQFKYSKTVEVDLGVPSKFELSQNYPNPFNPTTVIKYEIPEIATFRFLNNGQGASFVTLKVYDVLGNEISTLVNKNQEAGNYKVNFDAGNLTSGVYFYTLKVGDYLQTKRMILLR